MVQVIIVTGASRGIGLAVATYLLRPPHQRNVVVVARTSGPLENLQSQYPGQVEVIAGDLAEYETAKRAVDGAVGRWGRLDGLVLNHGTLDPVKRIRDSVIADWEGSFKINVFSCVEFVKTALPHLRHSKGRIILTSSGAAQNAYSTWGAYGASKAALNHLGLTLSVEEPDITTISIRPGVVDTDMQREIRETHVANMDAQDAEKFGSLKREGKLLKPEQPGYVMAKLVMDARKELSGRFLT
ncbi:MAG: hypothetical protein M1837_000998 [Sclerophora amabilis]|nr:MAG: hypothetical protein M1837_000998 [Sclerophora amabilis]